MPFGKYARKKYNSRKRTLTKRTRTSPSARANARKRRTNAPVKAARKKRRTSTGKNTNAVKVLAKQVRSLQHRDLGHYQVTEHYAELKPYVGTRPHSWGREAPLCFVLNDYSRNSSLYGGYTPKMEGYSTLLQQSGIAEWRQGQKIKNHLWSKLNVFNTSARDHPIKGTIFDYNRSDNNNTLEGAYMPIKIEYDFVFDYQLRANSPGVGLEPIWVRIDFFKLIAKRATRTAAMNATGGPADPNDGTGMGPEGDNAVSNEFPQCLAGLRALAHPDPWKRNKFDSEYFRVLETKWIKLDGTTDRIVTTPSGHAVAQATSSIHPSPNYQLPWQYTIPMKDYGKPRRKSVKMTWHDAPQVRKELVHPGQSNNNTSSIHYHAHNVAATPTQGFYNEDNAPDEMLLRHNPINDTVFCLISCSNVGEKATDLAAAANGEYYNPNFACEVDPPDQIEPDANSAPSQYVPSGIQHLIPTIKIHRKCHFRDTVGMMGTD